MDAATIASGMCGCGGHCRRSDRNAPPGPHRPDAREYAGAFHADMGHPRRLQPVAQRFEVPRHCAKRCAPLCSAARRRARSEDTPPPSPDAHPRPQHRSTITCIRASLRQRTTATPQVRSRHCHACSGPGATKNGASMQRGPDCKSGSPATAEMSASKRSPRERLGKNGPRRHHFHS